MLRFFRRKRNPSYTEFDVAHVPLDTLDVAYRKQLDFWYSALEQTSSSNDDAMFFERDLMLVGNKSKHLLPFKKQIPEDYSCALFMLKKLQSEYAASGDDDKRSRMQVLKILCREIEAEAANVKTKHLPLLTELMIRVMYKFERPDKTNGRNDRRGLPLSEEISSFKWGKLIGGLGMLLLGGVLVTAAVMTLMASFGAAAPLSAVLIGLGVQAATPAAIAVAAGAAYVGTHAGAAAVIGARDICTSVRDEWFSPKAPSKVIKQTVDTLFKPAPEEKANTSSPVPNSNLPSSKGSTGSTGSRNGGG